MGWPVFGSSKSDTPDYVHLLDDIGHDRSDNTTGKALQQGEVSAVQQPPKQISWFRRHTSGWRFSVLAGATSAFAVFIINLSIFVWAEKANGQHILFEGSCERTRKLNTAAHLLINVLSTTLLSASNYCMQCMSAPTRREVDDAHAATKWLDVGVQSARNLLNISRKRAVLYWLLGLSSLPLHLFYNSTVFSSIAANDYYVYSGNEAFANPRSENFTYSSPGSGDHIANGTAHQLFGKARAGALVRLEPADCLTAYSQVFVTSRGSLILIAPDDSNPIFNQGNATLLYETHEDIADNSGHSCPFDWMCFNNPPGIKKRCMDSVLCQFRLGAAKANIKSWQPFQKEVLYCLSEAIEEHCKLEYSTHLAVLVIILNAVKAVLMFYLAVGISEAPLMTVGDAVASFLETPDSSTQGMCLVTEDEIRDGAKKGGWVPMAKQYRGQRRRKFGAASRRRWIVTLGLLIFAVAVVTILLIWGMAEIPAAGHAAAFSLGLGAVTPITFIRWQLPFIDTSSLIFNVLVANSPQVILSFIYFSYNALFTCMSLAAEWSRFALERKGIRVSEVPLGHQRGKYFLQLPYHFGLPLLGVSVILHWLISQSIFLVAINAFEVTGDILVGGPVTRTEILSGEYKTCGYSPVAIVCAIVVGCVMFVVVIGTGYVRLPSGMPVVGSCSAAISAGCHGNGGRNSKRGQEKIMWGVIGSQEVEEVEVGHCGLSDRAVTNAVEGRLYAGSGVRKRL